MLNGAGGIREKKKSKRGSMTVEAAIALPIFIMFVFTIIYFMKVVYIHSTMQSALTQVARELSCYSYIYSVSGLKDIHDDANNELNSLGDEFKEQINSVIHTFSLVSEAKETAEGNIKKLQNGEVEDITQIDDLFNIIDSTKDKRQELIKLFNDIATDPVKELKVVMGYFISDAFGSSKTWIMSSLVDFMMSKHLIDQYNNNIESRLDKLNIKDRVLDYSMSTFFEDNKTIELVLEYTIDPILPIDFLPDLRMQHCVVINGWLDGVGIENINKAEQVNLWRLADKTRGREIEIAESQKSKYRNYIKTPKMFKAVDVYKVISKGGDTKSDIVIYNFFSINPYATSYKKKSNIRNRITEEVEKLEEFTRYEHSGIEIDVNDYGRVYKKAILIIPENLIPDIFMEVFEGCKKEAGKKGVTLTYIQDFGTVSEGEERK